jgi:VWFA-related protein
MRLAARALFFLIPTIISISTALAGDTVRDLNVAAGGSVDVVNLSGRVLAQAEAPKNAGETAAKLTISSPKAVTESEVRVSTVGGRTTITVAAKDPKQRIDLELTLPERTSLKVETAAGGIEAMGNFARIEARTDTGTVAVDVPTDALQYQFQWTESRPRYLADFDIEKVKEKSGGRFEIKGRYASERGPVGSVRRYGSEESETRPVGSVPSIPGPTPRSKDHSVTLDLTTARGIILLNVSPNEVMSDLRERPLSNAAKAIIRSGDSFLMEAIRRAAPKYFGDYARTLPPLSMEPRFAATKGRPDVPNAAMKTAVVRVTDLKNRAIDGMSASDFDVVENGTSRDIVAVRKSTAPFNLVLLLDVSGSVENYVNFIRRAARNFVETVDPRDRVSIVIFNDDTKMLSGFTTDKGKLSKSLDTFDAGGGTAYYDALAYVVSDTLRSLHGERSAIVVLTDGDDNRSFLAFDSLTGSIQESGALIYPLYVPSALIAASVDNPNADIDPVRRKYMSLSAKAEGEGEQLAKISGGVYYPITAVSQIQQAYEDIVSQLRSAYAITYRSDITETGVTPRLKIRSKRENTFTTVTSVVAEQ